MSWFCQNAVFLPKCLIFTFSQEYFVFNQYNLKFIVFTQKYLPFLCLCYQSPCALLLTGRICDHDVVVVCILPRIYFFWSWKPWVLANLQLYELPWFLRFSQKCAVFILPFFCRDFLLSLDIITDVTTHEGISSFDKWLKCARTEFLGPTDSSARIPGPHIYYCKFLPELWSLAAGILFQALESRDIGVAWGPAAEG